MRLASWLKKAEIVHLVNNLIRFEDKYLSSEYCIYVILTLHIDFDLLRCYFRVANIKRGQDFSWPYASRGSDQSGVAFVDVHHSPGESFPTTSSWVHSLETGCG